MGFDHVDLIYANPPPDGLPIAEMVAAVGELSQSGQGPRLGHRQLGGGPFLEATRAAADQGVPAPCAAQLPYSLVRRDWVESDEMTAALEASGAGVVASFVMAGGVLTGKYDAGQTGTRRRRDRRSAVRRRPGTRRSPARARRGDRGQPGRARDRVRARQPRRRHRAVRRHVPGSDRRERGRARRRSRHGRAAAGDLSRVDLLDGSAGADPALDVALPHALLGLVAAGRRGPVLRCYRPHPTVAFGRRDSFLAGFPGAVAAAQTARVHAGRPRRGRPRRGVRRGLPRVRRDHARRRLDDRDPGALLRARPSFRRGRSAASAWTRGSARCPASTARASSA